MILPLLIIMHFFIFITWPTFRVWLSYNKWTTGISFLSKKIHFGLKSLVCYIFIYLFEKLKNCFAWNLFLHYLSKQYSYFLYLVFSCLISTCSAAYIIAAFHFHGHNRMKTDFRRSIFDGTIGQKENLRYNRQKLFLTISPDPKPLIAGNFGLISFTSVQLNLMSTRRFGVFSRSASWS